MTTPKVSKLNCMQQGDQVFPWVGRWIDNLVLVAATAQTYNIAALRTAAGLPANAAFLMIFAADAAFWANWNGTAVDPASDITDGSGSEFSPNQRYIDASVTSVSFISTPGCHLSIQVFAVG